MDNFTKYTDEFVTSVDELRELTGEPHEAVIKKVIAQIDDQARNYISKSPLFFLSTANAEGHGDVSPRGDTPGFVRVLDNKVLVFPQRSGNRRVDSLTNILTNPQVGLLFLIPGMDEVLRVNGRACIIRDQSILEAMQLNGVTPALGVMVEVEECFVHCPRALKSSKLWDPESWLNKEEQPSVKDIFHAHLKINGMTV